MFVSCGKREVFMPAGNLQNTPPVRGAVSETNAPIHDQALAEKIRQLRPFAPSPFPGELFVDRQAPAAPPEERSDDQAALQQDAGA